MTTMSEGCDCSAAINLMAKRGAPLARRMRDSGLPESMWPPNYVLIHFAEEKQFFFPLIPVAVQRVLLRHHAQFTREIRQYGRIVDKVLFKKHAAIENKWAKELLRTMH